MATAERTVRHLRLRAGSEAAVRRMLPVLEDALRCASLADAGARLLVVRRLALGRLPPDITSSALAQLIGQRAAQAALHWVAADSPGAESAPCVAFAGALQARVQLALRLVRGQACGAWYWPRAVPEFDAAAAVPLALRRMAWTIAGWPEARVALPAWAAAVASDRAGAARLAACMPGEDGEALLQRADVPVPRKDARHPDLLRAGEGEAPVAGPTPSRSQASRSQGVLPSWVETLLRTASTTLPAAASAAVQAEPAQPTRSEQASQLQSHDLQAREGGRTEAVQPAQDASRAAIAPGPVAEGGPAVRHRNPLPVHPLDHCAPQPAPSAQSETAAPAVQPVPSHRVTGEVFLEPTACGGLLFLLPLLQRLGLPDWLPPDDSCFASLVLRTALRRLGTPAEDPAWQLLAREEDGRMAHPAAAPGAWSDPLLAPLRGHAPLATRLARSTTTAGQAQVWLDAARYWLRRAGHTGLATLVLRPARLAVTATHADVAFDLAHADLRVRRLGLDLDPGWLPWFGRVVGFHYERSGP